ncbi:hypothetical protein VTK26DRAFT_2157 [Humicola hyalothermophila]
MGKPGHPTQTRPPGSIQHLAPPIIFPSPFRVSNQYVASAESQGLHQMSALPSRPRLASLRRWPACLGTATLPLLREPRSIGLASSCFRESNHPGVNCYATLQSRTHTDRHCMENGEETLLQSRTGLTLTPHPHRPSHCGLEPFASAGATGLQKHQLTGEKSAHSKGRPVCATCSCSPRRSAAKARLPCIALSSRCPT